jgi:hypothetical protein
MESKYTNMVIEYPDYVPGWKRRPENIGGTETGNISSL